MATRRHPDKTMLSETMLDSVSTVAPHLSLSFHVRDIAALVSVSEDGP